MASNSEHILLFPVHLLPKGLVSASGRNVLVSEKDISRNKMKALFSAFTRTRPLTVLYFLWRGANVVYSDADTYWTRDVVHEGFKKYLPETEDLSVAFQ